MTDPQKPTAPPLAWHPAPAHCPRCVAPLKARGTPTFSKIIAFICVKCGWAMDVEAIRLGTKATAVPPDVEEPKDG